MFDDLRMGFIFNLMLLLAVAGMRCFVYSFFKQPGTEASFCFRQSFNLVNGCAAAHRKQLMQKRPSKWLDLHILYSNPFYVQNGSRDRDPQIPACYEGMTQSQITLERCFQGAHVGDTERNSEALPVSLQLLGARGKDGGAAWLNRLIAFQEHGLVMSIWGLVAEILQCLGSE